MLLLGLLAVSVFLFAQQKGLGGFLHMTLMPLLLGVFVLGFLTGRPCLQIDSDHFAYRGGPMSRTWIVAVAEIRDIEILRGEILVYCVDCHNPVRIRSGSFHKSELSSVNEYFQRLRAEIGA